MASFKDILPKASPDQEAFILDHGKTVDGKLKYQDNITSYGWNVRRFNKMHKGAFILRRRPGKDTIDRKFEIYAGGYVEKISDPDKDGNVVAVISHPFEIIPPIRQGDPFLEGFKWNSKTKKPGSWEHFWNQYGMNTISYEDYEGLLKRANCKSVDDVIGNEPDITEADLKELEKQDASGFTVVFDESGPVHNKKEKKYSGVAKKVDYDRIRKSNDKTGAMGEEIVMSILTREAEKNGWKSPIHASKIEGDGLGYDIRAFDKYNKEIHIEVKATKKNVCDGFEITYNEVNSSRDTNYKYLIYVVYDLDMKTKNCKIKVYEGPVNEDNFTMFPTKYAVYQK